MFSEQIDRDVKSQEVSSLATRVQNSLPLSKAWTSCPSLVLSSLALSSLVINRGNGASNATDTNTNRADLLSLDRIEFEPAHNYKNSLMNEAQTATILPKGL